MWEQSHHTFSTTKRSVMALSISITCDSFKTEAATAAAISEGQNSKKSIPAINFPKKTLVKLITPQGKQSTETEQWEYL